MKQKSRSRRREQVDEESSAAGMPARPQEQLLIDRLAELHPGRALCLTAGRAQFARQLAQAQPQAHVSCLFLDLFQQQQSERESGALPKNLEFLCQSDFPEDAVDLVAIPCSYGGVAELTRDVLQQGHERLELKGRLIAAIDNPEDQWLHDELKKLFPKVTREPHDRGVFYSAIKTAALTKQKHFDAEFVFRDQERLIYAYSRPGVFSHRHLDVGARALINAMGIHPHMRTLDLGCGSGAVGLAAALRADHVSVLAVDSNPRAIQCARRGADRNGITTLSTQLDADGSTLPTGEFDLVLANPPYFSHYRLAEHFIRTAVKTLNPRGELLLVTKAPAWFRENLPLYFRNVNERLQKEYFVFSCKRAVS